MKTTNRWMLILKTMVVWSLTAAIAWAIPTPKEIEDALVAKDYANAKVMVGEVLREKPTNARAHLLNAYIMVHADHKPELAAHEIKLAREFDKKGDVTNSALFGRTVAEIDAYHVSAAPTRVDTKTQELAPANPPHEQADSHGLLYYVFWVALILGLVVWIAKRVLPAPVLSRGQAYGNGGGFPSAGPVVSPSGFGGAAYGGNVSAQPMATNQGGMGVMGTIASVGAGIVAGELITDAIRGHSNRSDNWGYQNNTPAADASYIPFTETPAVNVDSESERDSLRSGGSDQSWDVAGDSQDFSSSGGDGGSGWD